VHSTVDDMERPGFPARALPGLSLARRVRRVDVRRRDKTVFAVKRRPGGSSRLRLRIHGSKRADESHDPH